MTDLDIAEDGLAYAERAAAQAFKALETAVGLLERRLDRARAAQEDLNDDAMVQEMKAVNAAFQLAIQQEGKARDAGSRRYRAGGGATVLDLDAARSEIGSRLARLRAARGDGGVPVGTE